MNGRALQPNLSTSSASKRSCGLATRVAGPVWDRLRRVGNCCTCCKSCEATGGGRERAGPGLRCCAGVRGLPGAQRGSAASAGGADQHDRDDPVLGACEQFEAHHTELLSPRLTDREGPARLTARAPSDPPPTRRSGRECADSSARSRAYSLRPNGNTAVCASSV